MKILICLLLIIIYSFVETDLKSKGISLGAIPTIILYSVFVGLPLDVFCEIYDIRKFNKKFPGNLFENLDKLIISYKNDFLKENSFNISDLALEIFDNTRKEISSFNRRKIEKVMIKIIREDSSPSNFVLKQLEINSVAKLRTGSLSEFKEQYGTTYAAAKIYEYVQNVMLKDGKITPIQHQNKIIDIESIIKNTPASKLKDI